MKAGWLGSSIPVEFVGELHKQAVNQWTGWMKKKETPDIMYGFIHMYYIVLPCYFATVRHLAHAYFITKETYID